MQKVENLVFDNLFGLMSAAEFCSRFGYSIKTIYDWKYRPKKNKVPADLVVKFRGKLFVKTELLKGLIPSDSPSVDGA
ncbi:MAG: hypothetical protein HY537_05630 [Deltaproteobacteria bacterium]|nr:hypothetical protein [Deltaproteobacteria bacterium]